jgi:hypothetical protein
MKKQGDCLLIVLCQAPCCQLVEKCPWEKISVVGFAVSRVGCAESGSKPHKYLQLRELAAFGQRIVPERAVRHTVCQWHSATPGLLQRVQRSAKPGPAHCR